MSATPDLWLLPDAIYDGTRLRPGAALAVAGTRSLTIGAPPKDAPTRRLDGIMDVALGLAASAHEPIAGGRHKVFGHPDLAVIPQTSTISSHLPRALGVAWATLVASELIAAQQGLGALIQNASSFFQLDIIYVGIVCIGFIALAMDVALRAIARRFVSWQERIA